MIKKKCSTCKKEKELKHFGKYNKTKDGYQYNCKICSCKHTRQYYKNNREKVLAYNKEYTKCNSELIKHKYKIYNQSPNGKYSMYKKAAKKDGREFKLSLDEFQSFWQKNCYYCNSKIQTIGLDRINNNLGYVIDNIVPCCTVCNKMKLKLSFSEFKKHIEKIYYKLTENPNPNDKLPL